MISQLSLGCSLLIEVVFGEGVTGSFFTNSSSFWVTISKAVCSLGLGLACLVVGSLTKDFSRVWIGLLRFPGCRSTLLSILSSILPSYFPMTPIYDIYIYIYNLPYLTIIIFSQKKKKQKLLSSVMLNLNLYYAIYYSFKHYNNEFNVLKKYRQIIEN